MDECKYFGCLYNKDGCCNYDNAPLQFPCARACHQEDMDIVGDMGEILDRNWNRKQDGSCCLNGCLCLHEGGCDGCPTETCYSHPASYEKEG